jgi:hypothetical protein
MGAPLHETLCKHEELLVGSLEDRVSPQKSKHGWRGGISNLSRSGQYFGASQETSDASDTKPHQTEQFHGRNIQIQGDLTEKLCLLLKVKPSGLAQCTSTMRLTIVCFHIIRRSSRGRSGNREKLAVMTVGVDEINL